MSDGAGVGRGVRAWAGARPGGAAVVDGDLRWTYRQLHEEAGRLAGAFAAAGADPGDRVAVMLPNSATYLAAGVAAAYLQTAFVPVNWHLKAAEVAWILADSAARVLLAAEELAPGVDGAVPAGCRLLVAGRELAGEPPTTRGWVSPQWMFYTSGTTGRPKGVVHERFAAEAMTAAQDGLCALWGFTADDVYLLSGPGYHAGPGGYAFTTLYAGGCVVVLPEWDARTWYRLVERERVTTTFLTPAHLIRLLEVPAAERGDLSSLRLVIHGGAPCPTEVKRAALDLFAPAELAELYGASEGGVTRIGAAEWRDRPGSVGRPWPGVQVRILDDAGRPVPTGSDGLVYVRPAGGARFHYHQDEQKTASAWRDDAFTVGDIGHVDPDGYLYITDRATDMVLWGGVNIYPREVEEVLHTHPDVVDCAVLGVPDDRYGELLVAVVETRGEAGAEDLRRHCAEHLADFKCPRRFLFVGTVPRDPNGKVRKRQLRDRLAAAALPGDGGRVVL